MLLSSRYTLDAANPAARREISSLADLIGAVRLPSGAHSRVAGTHAVTDLLVLRRRPESAQPVDDSWVRTELVDVDGHDLRLNSYLAQHPEQVLGELKLARGLYENHELVVDGDPSAAAVAARIRAWGAHLADTVAGTRPVGPRAEDLRQRDTPGVDGGVLFAEPELVEAPEGLWDGHLVPLPSGEFAVVQDGLQVPFATARTIRAELRALCGLRDRARRLLRAEAESLTDTPAIDTERTLLRAGYHEYVRGWGPINRFTERRTGRTDTETGEERTARIMPPAVRALRGDPFAPLVIGLEVFDEATGQVQPAALLRERVVAPRAPVLGADTPQDGLAICLDSRGRVELETIAQLLGDTPEGARTQLGELVYDTPDGQLLPAAEYLSGNVRGKLDAARLAAVACPELDVNVTALQRVLPPDLGADEVHPQLGAAWISDDEHREFLVEILRDPTLELERAGGGVWGVRGNNASIAARSEWGTSRMAAPAIAKALLEQRVVQVTDEVDDGRRVVNSATTAPKLPSPVETAAAQEKAEAIKERFGEWCWEDPERAERLLAEYNRRFNSIVLRDYSAEGERLSLPGLVRTFTPMPHQRAAVARILSEPAVGLFHQVGAGQTAEMIIGPRELRRLGMGPQAGDRGPKPHA